MSTVYFIQQGRDSLFKIGYSENGVDDRLKSLQTGNPKKLRVFGQIEYKPNSQDKEQAFHKQFAQYRAEGEWFCLNPVIIAETIEKGLGKVLVSDPLSVEFNDSKQRNVIIQSGKVGELAFKLAKAKAVRLKKIKDIMRSMLFGLPISTFICGFLTAMAVSIRLNHSLSGNSFDMEMWLKYFLILFPFFYISSIGFLRDNEIKVDDDEIYLEYIKLYDTNSLSSPANGDAS